MIHMKKGIALLVAILIMATASMPLFAATTTVEIPVIGEEILSFDSFNDGHPVVVQNNQMGRTSYLNFYATGTQMGSFTPLVNTTTNLENTYTRFYLRKLPDEKVAFAMFAPGFYGPLYLNVDSGNNVSMVSSLSTVPEDGKFSPSLGESGRTTFTTRHRVMHSYNSYVNTILFTTSNGTLAASIPSVAAPFNRYLWSIYKTSSQNMKVETTKGRAWLNALEITQKITNPNGTSVNGWSFEFDLPSNLKLALPSHLTDTPTTTGTITRHKIKGVGTGIANIPAGGAVSLNFLVYGGTPSVPSNYKIYGSI